MNLKRNFYHFLKWLEKYTKTDMIYFFKGFFWWTWGRIFGFLFSFLILVAFAHFATKEVYGAYQYILSTATILGIISLPGINLALTRAIAKGKEKTFFLCEKEKLKFGFLNFSAILAISLWYLLHRNFELGISFLIAAIFFPLISFFSLYPTFWQGRKKFDIQNIYFIINNFLGASILISFIYFEPTVINVILGYFLGFSFSNFLFWFLTRKKIEKTTDEDRETISFGKHLTFINLPLIVSSQIDKVILWQSIGPVGVAVFSFAWRLVQRLQELIPFSPLALPKMAERNLREVKIKRRVLDKFLKLFLLSVPLSLLYILFCPFFFKLFFPNYTESVIYSQVLSLILILSPFSFLATSFIAEAKKKELYILNFGSEVLRVILFLILIPCFKIWGAVISILIAQTFQAILTFYFFKRL